MLGTTRKIWLSYVQYLPGKLFVLSVSCISLIAPPSLGCWTMYGVYGKSH